MQFELLISRRHPAVDCNVQQLMGDRRRCLPSICSASHQPAVNGQQLAAVYRWQRFLPTVISLLVHGTLDGWVVRLLSASCKASLPLNELVDGQRSTSHLKLQVLLMISKARALQNTTMCIDHFGDESSQSGRQW